MSNPPQRIAGRYQISQQLGQGGMAAVYHAHDETLGRDVAIKLLSPDNVKIQSERFLREARAVARLSHPNIMMLFDMGQEKRWHYLVLEYVPGLDLYRMMEQQGGAFSVMEAVRIITDVLKALAYAHAQNIIHRDIKPENIMLTPEGHVKVMDFGLAHVQGDERLTKTGMIVGTVYYMAPETARNGGVDHRSDLYAVGAVLYELLTGEPPFTGNSPSQVLAASLNKPLTPPALINPGIPEGIEQIIIRLLEKDPADRFQSADEVLRALPTSAEMESLMAAEANRITTQRLSRSLLERLVRSTSSTTTAQPTDEPEDSLLDFSADQQVLSQELLVYAAQEDTMEATEAERRRMARELEESVISQLNLMLSQASAYEQTMTNPQALMAVSVMSTLIRQVLQQTRDLENRLRPTILDSLGLEPALESLAGQESRTSGLQITLSLQRMRERLPPQLELALFRATQDAIDRASRQANASRMEIRLERHEDAIYFSVADNGITPSGEVLRITRQRIEALGGKIELGISPQGGLIFSVHFIVEQAVEMTEREMEVIQLVAEGLSNKEIAALLYISPRTVKFHLDNIYSKLAVNTRTEAAIYALRHGWTRK